MSDREKVIKGLEKIAEFFKARGDMAVGDGKMLLSWMRAVEDAIALLKAQEPRVLTLEEAREALKTDTVIWLEVRCDNEVYACLRMRGKDYFVVENDELLNVDDFEQDTYGKDYGSNVRCWSSRPTDEQREATPWES